MVPAPSDIYKGLLIPSAMSQNPTARPFHSERASEHLDWSGQISIASILEAIAVIMVVIKKKNCSEGGISLTWVSSYPTLDLLLQMHPVLNLKAFLEAVCISFTMSKR